MLVEVIACTFADAVVARDAGADRIELCLAIEVGGLTPYIETIQAMKSLDGFPIVTMVRPQPGGFVNQNQLILSQIDRILSLGVPNCEIITGALTEECELDLVTMRAIRSQTNGIKLGCHRCFDLTSDPFTSLEQLIDLGFDRVLTSGQAVTAIEGADIIKKLNDRANGRIEIIAGAGIRPHNVRPFIDQTGITQVHASCFEDPPPPTKAIDYGPTLKLSSQQVRELVIAAKAERLGL